MSTLRTLKRRITSVTSTKQITKAMQLVAASKLRKAEQAAHGPQYYVAQAESLLGQLARDSEGQRHPLVQPRPLRRALTVVIAGDRGMAGAFNANVIKAAHLHIQELGVHDSLISVGKRTAPPLLGETDADLLAAYDVDETQSGHVISKPIASHVIQLYLEGAVDRVDVIYTSFISTIKQEVVRKQLLPLQPIESPKASSQTLLETDALLTSAAERLIEATILQAVLESRASEQAARMLSMMNATNNAKDLIEDLTLAYHEARQSAITQELAEISTGAEAMNQTNGGAYA